MASFTNAYQFDSENIAAGCPGYTVPLSVGFSPGGNMLTYLFPDDSGIRQLYSLDLNSLTSQTRPVKLFDAAALSSDGLSLQEQLRRERMRLFTSGVASYEWMDSTELAVTGCERLMIPLNGKAIIYDHSESNRRKSGDALPTPSLPLCVLGDDSGLNLDLVDPHLAPDGNSVAYVMDDDLYVQMVDAPAPASDTAGLRRPVQRLTYDGDQPGVTCGLADFVAQEEMDRYRGFWWSPDSSKIAYTKADESHVPQFHITHPGKDDPHQRETHRYPFSGEANPMVTLHVAHLDAKNESALVKTVHCRALVDPFDERFRTTPAAKCKTETEVYIARVGWWPDNSIMVQVLNRAQNVLKLLRVDPHTGDATVLLEEVSEYWVNLHNMLHILPSDWVSPNSTGPAEPGSFSFIWCSERSGYKQLYLHRYDHRSKTTLFWKNNITDIRPIGGGGDFVVDSIDGVDAENNIVYFSGNCDAPTEKHLYAASLEPAMKDDADAPTDLLQLTAEPGWHTSVVNVKASVIAISFSSVTVPLRMTVFSFDSDSLTTALAAPLSERGEMHSSAKVHGHQQKQFKFNFSTALRAECTVLDNAPEYLAALTSTKEGPHGSIPKAFQSHPSVLGTAGFIHAMTVPELHTIRSKDDSVDLVCAVYMPPSSIGDTGPLPAVVAVYGGPHVQRVANNWILRGDLRTQRLVQQGCIVIKCDNRGSNRRGIAFEAALHRNMGDIEMVDQQTAVEYFVGLGLVDPMRVGMVGWSYGGYMSAMAVCRAPQTFSCAIAGAPVTHWDGYDTCYTERYMGTPQNNPVGYRESSVMHHVPNMQGGNLMLIHGLIDENVHFRHTARLINALVAHRKRYELVLFPCERHSPHRSQDRVYLEDIIFEFFSKHLGFGRTVNL